jgi:hypothetical protein
LKLKGCMLRQVTIEHSEREKDKAKMQFFIPSDAGKICAVLFQWRSALQSDIRHSYCTCSQNLAESGRIWHLAEPAQIFWNCAI